MTIAERAKEEPRFPEPAEYGDEYYAWCYQQAELLRQKRYAEADLPNIIEELEGLASEQRHRLWSSYRDLIVHLLRWQFESKKRKRAWQLAILQARIDISCRERCDGALRSESREIITDAYRSAVIEAAVAIRVPRNTFSFDCPYTAAQLRDFDWLPERRL